MNIDVIGKINSLGIDSNDWNKKENIISDERTKKKVITIEERMVIMFIENKISPIFSFLFLPTT